MARSPTASQSLSRATSAETGVGWLRLRPPHDKWQSIIVSFVVWLYIQINRIESQPPSNRLNVLHFSSLALLFQRLVDVNKR